MNFALHFTAWRSRSVRGYLNDTEFRAYVSLLATVAVATTAYLYLSGAFPTLAGRAALRRFPDRVDQHHHRLHHHRVPGPGPASFRCCFSLRALRADAPDRPEAASR